MRTIHGRGIALQIGFWFALVTAALLVGRSASGISADAASGPSADAAVDAPGQDDDDADTTPSSAPVGIYKCLLEDRKPASLVVFQGAFGHNPCSVTATELPGSSKLYCDEDGCMTCLKLHHKWHCPLL